MDHFLKMSNRKRVPIKGDGHCLTRAVCRGGKQYDLLSNNYSYKALFSDVVDHVKNNIHEYTNF